MQKKQMVASPILLDDEGRVQQQQHYPNLTEWTTEIGRQAREQGQSDLSSTIERGKRQLAWHLGSEQGITSTAMALIFIS